MIFAKLSTAITIPFGPVLDSTGAEFTTAVVAEVKISKNNGTPTALNVAATLTHKEVGIYELVLTTSDISAVGQATITLSKTTYVAPPVHLIVLPAKVYDSFIAGTDNLEVDAIQWLGVAPLALSSQQVQAVVPTTQKVDVETIKTQAVAVTAAGTVTFPNATVASTTNITAGTIATVTGNVGGSVASVTGAVGSVTGNVGGSVVSVTGAVGSVTGAVGSVTGAVGSVTAAVTVGTNNDKTGYGLSAAAVQAIWDALTAALTTVGSIGKKLADWVIGTSQTGDSFARLGAPAGASVSADVAAVKTDTAAILVDTGTDGVIVANHTTAAKAQINAEVVDVLNVDTLVDGKTITSGLRIIAAGVLGKVSGAGSGTEIFVGLDGATTRATVTADISGNRTAVVYV